MSSVDPAPPGEEARVRKDSMSSNLRGPKEKPKSLKSLSMKMMEIVEKLESVNQQCHVLQVENKGNYNDTILEGVLRVGIMGSSLGFYS